MYFALRKWLIAGRNDPSILNHQHDGSFWRACPVKNAFWDDETLPGQEADCAIFQIDEQFAFYDIKELIVIVVLVPMVFAFHHAQADDGVIHLAERLIEPLVGAGTRESFLVDQFKGLMENIEPRFVRKIFASGHDCAPPSLFCCDAGV